MSRRDPEPNQARRALGARLERTILDAEFNRRDFIRKSGLTLLSASSVPALLAAAPASAAPAAADAKVGGALNFLSWQGYDLPKIATPWLHANHITLNPTYLSSQDEATAKLSSPQTRGTFDVYTYYQAYKTLYSQLQIVTPLDDTRIPNLKGLMPHFAGNLSNFWVDPNGQRTGVPWTFNVEAVCYDASQVSAPKSYFDILDPKFKKRIVIVDDPIAVFTIGALMVGAKVQSVTKAQLAKITSVLKELIAHARDVSPNYGDATSQLVAGDVAFCWPAFGNQPSLAAQAGKKTVKIAIPKEGAMATTDAWAIPPGAPDVANAYAWINETLVPEIQAKAAAYLLGGTVVSAAIPLLNRTAAALFPYKHIDEYFSHAVLYGIPPQQSSQYMTYSQMTNLWTQLKA